MNAEASELPVPDIARGPRLVADRHVGGSPSSLMSLETASGGWESCPEANLSPLGNRDRDGFGVYVHAKPRHHDDAECMPIEASAPELILQ